MRKSLRIVAITAVALLAATAVVTSTSTGRSLQFVLGGALVNLGYRMQDHLASYDFDPAHEHEITPEQIWHEMQRQNELSSGVRQRFPRTVRHPLVALVACMDARIDTSELAGDTRKYYYVLRTAGSVLDAKEVEMLELAVENGVRLIVWTTHTECAAEGVAADPRLRARYPALTRAVDLREQSVAALLARPTFAERIARGDLLIKRMAIDTETDALRPL